MARAWERWLTKITTGLLYMVVIVTPLFYLREAVYPYVLAKTLVFQGLVELLFFAWLALLVVRPDYRPRRNSLGIALLVFLAALILTSLTSADVARSFWSTQERVTGTVLFLHLAAFAFVLASLWRVIDGKKLFAASFITSGLVSILAILQLWIPNLLLMEHVGNRPGATFGNPTFFAGYLAFNIFIGLYLLFSRLRERKGIRSAGPLALAGLLILQSIALIHTQTRGDILGVAVGVFALMLLAAFRRPDPSDARSDDMRRRAAWAAAALAAFTLLFWFTRAAPLWAGVPGLNRFRDVSFENKALTPRLIALRAAWKGFLEKPLLGWGPENYNLVFNTYYDPRALEINYQETRFDKPHNLFLEYLVTGGIVLFLAFAALIGTLMKTAFGLRDRFMGSIVIAATLAYLARSVFVFDTLGPLLMLFLIVGAILGMREVPEGARDSSARAVPAPPPFEDKLLGSGALCVGILLAYTLNFLSIRATRDQYWGFIHFVKGRPEQALASFKQAVGTWSPYRSYLKRDYAIAVAEGYFYNPGRVSAEEANAAVRAMEEVVRAHPKDAYNHNVLVDIYNQTSQVDPVRYLASAEREAARALELSPNRQEVYFSLAKTKSLKFDYQGAIDLLAYAISLSPNVPDGHFYYGLVAYAAGDNDRGYKELAQAIALGRRWKNENEPRVIANFFANSGHLDEAIELYKISLGFRDDPEARVKLAVAYYYKDDFEAARREFKVSMDQFDITKSLSYQSLIPILRDLGLLP